MCAQGIHIHMTIPMTLGSHGILDKGERGNRILELRMDDVQVSEEERNAQGRHIPARQQWDTGDGPATRPLPGALTPTIPQFELGSGGNPRVPPRSRPCPLNL